MKIIFDQKNFNIFVGTPLDSRVNIYINFNLNVYFKVSAAYCSHCLPPVSLKPVAFRHQYQQHWWNWWQNLPPVSLIPVANLPLVASTPVANLPLVSLIPVVHLDLQISPRIFEKIWNVPTGILLGWGETDSWKKPEAKNLVTLSL